MRLPPEALEMFRARSFAHLALVDERGRPHVSPVWVDIDERGRILVNTAEGRVKARLLRIGAPVALSAGLPEDPYRFVAVRGRVVERTHDDADAAIHALSRKYRGHDFAIPAGQQRVTVLIEADSVHVH